MRYWRFPRDSLKNITADWSGTISVLASSHRKHGHIVLFEACPERLTPGSKCTTITRPFYKQDCIAKEHVAVAAADVRQHCTQHLGVIEACDFRSIPRILHLVHATWTREVHKGWGMSGNENLSTPLVKLLDKETLSTSMKVTLRLFYKQCAFVHCCQKYGGYHQELLDPATHIM